MKSTSLVANFSVKAFWATAVLISACSTLPHPSQFESDGATVSYAGNLGISPTVVFQSGLGDGMSVWASAIRLLPPTVSTFAYDRPGYGGSSPKPGRRDPCTVAQELHELLRETGRRPPYVLVGHSLGGLYQYAFAKLYPEEVGGVLLIDATHPDHWLTIQQRAENTAMVLRGLRAVKFSDTEKREFDAQAECLADLTARDNPRIPAKQLVRGKAELGESAEFQALSRELAARWPELLPGMQLSRVDGAGHYIQKERPQLVADEIRHLVDSIQPKRQ